MGRFGIPFIKKTRSDLLEIVGDAMFEYIGECNKLKPTGEEAFNRLHKKYGFAHLPISEVFLYQGSNIRLTEFFL